VIYSSLSTHSTARLCGSDRWQEVIDYGTMTSVKFSRQRLNCSPIDRFSRAAENSRRISAESWSDFDMVEGRVIPVTTNAPSNRNILGRRTTTNMNRVSGRVAELDRPMSHNCYRLFLVYKTYQDYETHAGRYVGHVCGKNQQSVKTCLC